MAENEERCATCGQATFGLKRVTLQEVITKVVDERIANKEAVTFTMAEVAKDQVRKYVKASAALLAIPVVVLGWFGVSSVMDIIKIRDDLRKSATQLESMLTAINTRAISLEGDVSSFEKRTGAAFKTISDLVMAAEASKAGDQAAADDLTKRIQEAKKRR